MHVTNASGRQRAARAVAARRGDLGMTQQELADKAGIDVKTVGSLEGRGRWPIARNRAGIERALGWLPGEMERIAAEDPAQRPAVFERLAKEIMNTDGLTPDEREAVIAAMREILATGRGGASGPSGKASG